MSRRRDEIVVRLATPDELVAADPRQLLTGAGRLRGGLEEVTDRLMAQKKVRRQQCVVFEVADLDGPEAPAELSERFERTVRRYGELRREEASLQREITWREGMASLLSGSVLFFVGVVLSYWFTRPEAPEFWQDLLGNGVFLVVAWVGLWYPLDLLFIARRPIKREARVLGALAWLPVLVRGPAVGEPGRTPARAP